MTTPSIALIPSKPAVCSDEAITLDVLVRITTPLPEVHFPRPPLNLAIVLDRSGSMVGEKKMDYARRAAAFVVGQLLPADRVSVTIFDQHVETIVPNAPAADKPAILGRIDRIQPRGATDLFGGWSEGARQAASHRVEGGINRVLILSDGLANAGQTDPNAIAAAARDAAAGGVGTTTLGVGDDYNEVLMEAMARAGDGRYYYIESPTQLVDVFQTELHGLAATAGEKASLGLEPGGGATVVDVLNDLAPAPITGRLMLPNLVAGVPIYVVARLRVPARQASFDAFSVRLAWDDPRAGHRLEMRARLDPLPAVASAHWSELPADPVVRERVALLMAARAQKEFALAHERNDRTEAGRWMGETLACLREVPGTPQVLAELGAVERIAEADRNRDSLFARKLARVRAYRRGTSQPESEPPAGPATSGA